MKILIVFYSRTGVTKKVAKDISVLLKADMEEIIDKKNRDGAMGYLFAGRDATFKKLTEVNEQKYNPADYDVIVIGTPVWAFKMCPAIRTYITKNKDYFKNVALFCTYGGTGANDTMIDLMELCGKNYIATLSLKTNEVLKNEYHHKLSDFAERIKNSKQL